MATLSPASPPAPAPGAAPLATPVEVGRAPLIPVALALTAGIVADHSADVPLGFSLSAAAAALAAWAATRGGRHPGLPLLYLALAVAALGAAHLHRHRAVFPADDIAHFATPEPRPARLYAQVAEEPTVTRRPHDGLQSFPRPDPMVAVVQALSLKEGDDWRPVSGRVRLSLAEPLPGLHVGDEVEVAGRLSTPPGPANPGEFDYAAYLGGQRIRAVMSSAGGVLGHRPGWAVTPAGWLAALHGWGQRALQRALPPERAGVAMALLLGEGSTLTQDDWDKYVRTGVVHVLAISGQHLVVLSAALWLVLRVAGVRRRSGAAAVALIVLVYALLTGGRPSALRAAVMVCGFCGGILFRRSSDAGNTFALAWIVVALLNPADLFNTGCQLSFLAVALLYGVVAPGFGFFPNLFFQAQTQADPLVQLIEESRPAWQRCLIWAVRVVALNYAIGLVIWLGLAPLVAARTHLVSPAALLIGPPVVFLSEVALLAGFLLLLASAVCGPLVPVFATVTSLSLAGCEWLVDACNRLPLVQYVGDVPDWWLWGFYVPLLAGLVLEPLRRSWRALALAGLAWLCFGLAVAGGRDEPDGLRCTFLAVGHGGCTVLETPDGQTYLYDSGSLAGPDVTRRQIAPFLWSRGTRRVDEVFLSHADLDHFNGLPALLERFAVGQVTCTPSFTDRPTAAVALTLAALRKQGVAVRTVRAGDRLTAGPVTLDVLHPPADGPEGAENVRSLVLLLRHAGHSLLLTGDLEGPGLDRVLGFPPPQVDVLMAPHHGSRLANTPTLADWARPRVVVSCQGPPRGVTRTAEPYTAAGAEFLGTWPHGAVTVHSVDGMLTVETFQSGKRLTLPDRH